MGKLRSFLSRIRGEVSTDDLIALGLKVGKGFRRNEHCIIDQSHCWLINIGDDVVLAPRVHILAHDASMWNATGYTKIAPVTIGNNVFIGAGSIILPGVAVGDDVVIGAGSVVTKDIPDGCVAAGNPAVVLGTYADFVAKHKACMENKPCYGEEYTLRSKDFNQQMKDQQLDEVTKHSFGYVR